MRKYLLLLFVFAACTKNETVPHVQSNNIPLAAGNWWKYDLNNNGRRMQSETMVVKEGLVQNRNAVAVQNKTYHEVGFQSDTVWMSRDGEDLVFHSGNPVRSELFRLKEQLSVGRSWTIALSNPPSEITVQEKLDLTVPAGSFKEVFKVQQVFNLPSPWSGYTKFTYWIKPRVGIIKQVDEYNNNMGTSLITRELVEYKLK